MTRRRGSAALWLAALGWLVGVDFFGGRGGGRRANNAPLPARKRGLSLQGFGVKNPLCREWGDDCSVCLRDDKDAAHCSTPGIACQPRRRSSAGQREDVTASKPGSALSPPDGQRDIRLAASSDALRALVGAASPASASTASALRGRDRTGGEQRPAARQPDARSPARVR